MEGFGLVVKMEGRRVFVVMAVDVDLINHEADFWAYRLIYYTFFIPWKRRLDRNIQI